jgi:hypothetical protein
VAADRPTASSTAAWSTTSARPNAVGSPARPPWPWTPAAALAGCPSTAIAALVLAALVTVTAVWVAFTG